MMANQLEFSVTLSSDEPVSAVNVRKTLEDIEKLLRNIEMRVTGSPNALANWKLDDDITLQVSASVNGVSEETLSRVVGIAQEGFSRAAHSTQDIVWPQEFSESAQKSAERILRRLQYLDSITVQASGHEPVIITSANIASNVAGTPKKRWVFASIEGTLELIQQSMGAYRLGIREHATRDYVRCTFSEDWLDRVKDYFGKRVVVEGYVTYDDNGSPRSIRDVESITPRDFNIRLSSFKASAPELIGDASIDEYIEEIRG